MSKGFSAHAAVSVDELRVRLRPRRGVCAREATPRAVGHAGVLRFPVTGVGAEAPTRQAHHSRPPPWFGPLLNELGAADFRSQRLDVVDPRLAADLPEDPGQIQPRPWSSSGPRSTSPAAPKRSSSAGTVSKPLAQSTF